jgi:DNA-binding transcriptional ArsR family regulator
VSEQFDLTEQLDPATARLRLVLAAVGAGLDPATAVLLTEAVSVHLAAVRPGWPPDARARLAIDVAISAVTFGRFKVAGVGAPGEAAAALLGLSPRTVKRHLRRVRDARVPFLPDARDAA